MEKNPGHQANVFVVRIGDYRPDLCRYTIPTIKHWAKKHGAVYREITERVFPDWPITYEKMQVHRLGYGAAWNILVDADFMLHPELPRFFGTIVTRDCVGAAYGFDASKFFDMDEYFLRDGRNRGIAGGFIITSRLTHDLWTPLEFGKDEALKRTRRHFIVDEYCTSRNLAKFGLKLTGVEYDETIAQKMIHIGNEEQTPEQRQAGVDRARELYIQWFGKDVSDDALGNGDNMHG